MYKCCAQFLYNMSMFSLVIRQNLAIIIHLLYCLSLWRNCYQRPELKAFSCSTALHECKCPQNNEVWEILLFSFFFSFRCLYGLHINWDWFLSIADDMYLLSVHCKRVSVELVGKAQIEKKLKHFEELTSASLIYANISSSGEFQNVLPSKILFCHSFHDFSL